MSLKPKVIFMEELALQIPALELKKNELLLIRDEIADRFEAIQVVVKENETLEAKTNEQVVESVQLFLEEWEKIRESYPEVRLGILEKTLEFVRVLDEKKPAADEKK